MKKKPDGDGPSNMMEIGAFIHCARCLKELPTVRPPQSPEEYARFSIGWTQRGFQVWCLRHDCNVLHVDFEGCQHPANTTARMN